MEKTFDYPISREASTLRRSVMRDLIARTAQPGIIPLSGGLPASAYLPVDELRACFDAVLAREGGDALQYRPPYAPLIEWITAHMRSRGVDCTPEQVFITNGNQQGLTILSRLFLDPDGSAVTEEITFTGINQVTAGRGAAVLTVPTDLSDGVDVDALEAAFMQGPQLCVLISDFHNPLGVSMSAAKREHVAALAARYGVPVVEDDPYSALRFTGERLAPIKAYDQAGMVFYLGSFSKMLAPAARLGWMVAPRELLPRITVLRESVDLEASALTQRAVAAFLRRDLLPPHLERLNAVNRDRAAALLDALDTHLDDVATWTQPEGGLFVWLTLHDATVNTWDLLDAALEAGVAYVPGSAFAVHGGYQNTIRLNFSKVDEADIREGVRRLTTVIR
jgi:2-aminoadipate transaminase